MRRFNEIKDFNIHFQMENDNTTPYFPDTFAHITSGISTSSCH